MYNQKAIRYYEEGRMFHSQGKLSSAERAYNKAVKIDRNFVEAYNNLGNVLVDRMRLREASNTYRKALKIRPDYPMLLNNLGNVLQLLGKNESAIKWLNKAIALDSGYADAHSNLGNAMRDTGNFDEAIKCFEAAVKIDPKLVEARVNLGVVQIELNRLDDAIANLEQATVIDPGHADAFFELGIATHRHGDAIGALAAYERAVALEPELASACLGLAMVKKFREGDETVALMEKQCNNPDISTENSILLNFALGKAYGDLAKYDKAFACIDRGNQLTWESRQHDVNAELAYFDQLKSAFPAGIFSSRIQGEATAITPIFIVGLPRSGKTLCETLLANNGQVHAAGERVFLEEILAAAGDLKDPRGLVEHLLSLPANEIAGLARNYLNQIQSSSGEELFVVDTMPGNYYYIGFIKLVFPNARIIHCFRDPMDACWFNYQKYFQGNRHDYTFDLATLATFYRGYSELMAHWHEVLPGFIHDLQYERLVTNIPEEMTRLAAFVGVDWDGACPDTYENQPLHTNDIGAWRHYESHLGQLLRMLD